MISIIKRVFKTEEQWGLKPLIIGAFYELIFFIKHPRFKYLFVIEAKDLDVKKEDKKVSERYIPTPYYILAISLKHIKNYVSDLQGSIFFDIGCGPGRTLYYSSTIGFSRLIGIEQSKKLTDLCRQNLKRYLSPHINSKIINENVRDIDFLSLINDFDQEKKATTMVFFLYTPFKDEMLRTLLNKFDELNNSFDCYIIYFGIQNEEIITQKNFSVAYTQEINQDTPLKIYSRKKSH